MTTTQGGGRHCNSTATTPQHRLPAHRRSRSPGTPSAGPGPPRTSAECRRSSGTGPQGSVGRGRPTRPSRRPRQVNGGVCIAGQLKDAQEDGCGEGDWGPGMDTGLRPQNHPRDTPTLITHTSGSTYCGAPPGRSLATPGKAGERWAHWLEKVGWLQKKVAHAKKNRAV